MPNRKWLDAHRGKCPKCEQLIHYKSFFVESILDQRSEPIQTQ